MPDQQLKPSKLLRLQSHTVSGRKPLYFGQPFIFWANQRVFWFGPNESRILVCMGVHIKRFHTALLYHPQMLILLGHVTNNHSEVQMLSASGPALHQLGKHSSEPGWWIGGSSLDQPSGRAKQYQRRFEWTLGAGGAETGWNWYMTQSCACQELRRVLDRKHEIVVLV